MLKKPSTVDKERRGKLVEQVAPIETLRNVGNFEKSFFLKAETILPKNFSTSNPLTLHLEQVVKWIENYTFVFESKFGFRLRTQKIAKYDVVSKNGEFLSCEKTSSNIWPPPH